MNQLSEKKFLIIDCQTTGMHPANGALLQIGWSLVDPTQAQAAELTKWTLKLPQSQHIPNKIKKLLQLTDAQIQDSVAPEFVFHELQKVVQQLGPEPMVIAHYAQFEKSFLSHFYLEHAQTDQLNFNLLCSQKIAKRLFPNLPSHNLKAMAGFFQLTQTPKNEVLSHVAMTLGVWKALIAKLGEHQVYCYPSLFIWLETKPTKSKHIPYQYNIDRLVRLELPIKPGIYRMRAKDKTVLYVGKATSLKSRVNSYFRGVKNRDRRKLEMLTQTWEIDILECDTPLEAALLEADEIKKWNPPYNILLKSPSRKIIFYNGAYDEYAEARCATYFNGPYKPNDWVMTAIEVYKSLKLHSPLPFFDETFTREVRLKAWELFCVLNDLNEVLLEELHLRSLFVLCYRLLKKFEQTHGKGAFQSWWSKEKKKNIEQDLTKEHQLALKMGRIFIRAAETMRKSRQLKRLFNTSLILPTEKKLTVVNGEFIKEHEELSHQDVPCFGITHYDRLSILLSAIQKSHAKLVY